MVHYDPEWTKMDKWKTLGRALFDHYKCLIVVEKLDINAHVHVQGYTCYEDSTFREKVKALTRDHWAAKAGKRINQKFKSAEADELGFQYMCKEGVDGVLYQQGFEPGELEELVKNSDAYVEEKKNSLKRHLHELDIDGLLPDLVHKRYKIEGARYYRDQEILPPPNFQKLVLNAMMTRKPYDEDRLSYVADRI